MADYKAAYEREKLARKLAEEKLESISRELYTANESLKIQNKNMAFEADQKNLLLNVFRYAQESQKLETLLPDLVVGMLNLAGLPFAIYDLFPADKTEKRFRSKIYVNKNLHTTKTLDSTLDERLVDEALDEFSVKLLYSHEPIYIKQLKQHVDDRARKILDDYEVEGFLGLPIVAKNKMTAIIYLFISQGDVEKDALVELFESITNQLSMAIEHRVSEDELEENYYRLKGMIHELEMTQKQLIHSEKMASVGQLSAGIAHEINNPVGFIKSNLNSLNDCFDVYEQYVALLLKLIDSHRNNSGQDKVIAEIEKMFSENNLDYLREDVSSILAENQDGIQRIIKIVSGLKKFSRASDEDWDEYDINSCIKEALKLCQNELKYNCEVSTDFSQLQPVFCNPGELTQVFLNLFVNASHAIKESGVLNIKTCEEEEGVSIYIADNGEGISQDNLENIFNPFFTTKPVGKGTGLGLSISFGIIQSHKGKIEVRSNVGQGTEFHIWLPSLKA